MIKLGGFKMTFLSVKEIAGKWGISERTVRNYCQQEKIQGAHLRGKTWFIPEDATRPVRKNSIAASASPLAIRLIEEKNERMTGGIYHKLQIELTYNSNHI